MRKFYFIYQKMGFKSSKNVIYLLLILVLITIILFLRINLFSFNEQKVINFSEPLIKVIEKYHQDNKNYPDNLKDLIPYYLPSLPSPPKGIKGNCYYYQKVNAQNFYYPYAFGFFINKGSGFSFLYGLFYNSSQHNLLNNESKIDIEINPSKYNYWVFIHAELGEKTTYQIWQSPSSRYCL